MIDQPHLRHPRHGIDAESKLTAASRYVVVAVGAIIACYVLSLLAGWPQRATALIVEEQTPSGAAGTAEHHPPNKDELPPLVMVVPFVLMLAAIAIMPLLHGAKHSWASNLHRFYVAGRLASVTVLYYALAHEFPIVGHFPARHLSAVEKGEPVHLGTVGDLLANAMLNEYLPLIVLLTCLY